MKHLRGSRSRDRAIDALRQRIVEEARGHFFSHGFRSVSMDDLGGEWTKSKKPLYAFSGRKRALLGGVLAKKFPSVKTTWKKFVRAYPHVSPAALNNLRAKMHRNWDEIKPP